MVMVLATAGFCALLWHRLQGLDIAAVLQALGRIGPMSWLAAGAATCASFWAVGRHDDTAHRHLGTGVPAGQARRAGFCGIALSQLLGLGVVTGALVRWRMLPSLTKSSIKRLMTSRELPNSDAISWWVIFNGLWAWA